MKILVGCFHIRNQIDNWAAEKAKTERKNGDFKLLQNGKGRNLFYKRFANVQ
ncbi:hypothetical protein PYS58_07845 [Chryseobacterium indologenes]|uniref:hypothetical protein n=1 Tax=Chryseobacterium TaxID=59732 RepID=UPI001624C08D|nr:MULTISPECIES: hypothetical protein [Chryseobacterium]MDM1555870.1 hypothetical protein [Chryseobacterium indologenes]WET51040.1 hypothetical protein PYS58_07845 [Chryseobacterium indologenes]